MMNSRTLAICAVGVVFLTSGFQGQALAQYRNFELGSDLASVSAQAHVAPSEAVVVHQPPVLLKDLEWRPSRWPGGTSSIPKDPVDRIVFSFYNDQLFRIVVEYDRGRTEGLTDADMIDAISATYGSPLARTSRPASDNEPESGPAIARWEGAGQAVVLYRSLAYRGALRLVVTEPTLDALTRKAIVQAKQLDAQEAPRREIARQKKEQDDARAASEKLRLANKAGFHP
jgi:hypothetical protein